MVGLLVLLFIGVIIIGSMYKRFRDSNYQAASGHTFLKTLFDKEIMVNI